MRWHAGVIEASRCDGRGVVLFDGSLGAERCQNLGPGLPGAKSQPKVPSEVARPPLSAILWAGNGFRHIVALCAAG